MKRLFLFAIMILASHMTSAAEHEELVKEMSKMAEAGDAEAAYHMGMFYNNGLGLGQNYGKAFKWFQAAEKKGDALAAYKLGCYYGGQAGDSVLFSPDKALHYKLISAHAGYSLAQHDVGLIYLKRGQREEALHFLNLAAHQGLSDSLKVLSYLYLHGQLVERDLAKAYAYLSLGDIAIYGERTARTMVKLGQLKTEMSSEDIEAGKALIAEWEIHKTPLTLKAKEGLSRSYKFAQIARPKQSK